MLCTDVEFIERQFKESQRKHSFKKEMHYEMNASSLIRIIGWISMYYCITCTNQMLNAP